MEGDLKIKRKLTMKKYDADNIFLNFPKQEVTSSGFCHLLASPAHRQSCDLTIRREQKGVTFAAEVGVRK